MSVVKSDSLVQVDSYSEQEYAQNGFVPQSEVTGFSYTSGRVAKPVYNKYNKNAFQVFGYYTDWSQYDTRLPPTSDFTPSACGRGVDLMKLDVEAYDKIILGFLGIVGDTGEKEDTINRAAAAFERKTNEPTFCDSWGDVLSYNNCGFTGWVTDDAMAMFGQQQAQGILGGLRKLHEQNPALRLSMSIGGWTMSQAFHFIAADATKRATFCAGLVDLYKRFPMFTEVDLDWEYPGAPGNVGNTYDDSDTANYVLLVGDLKQAFAAAGRSDVRISIAASANVEALVKTDIPAMLAAGLYGLNLMTYDFFGTPWAPELAHHTNLHSNGVTASDWSVDTAIEYLKGAGMPMNQVFIGYASYSRSAQGAEISSPSPLTGTYAPGSGTTTGSFESGCTEWYDTIANYLDLENQRGRNGFNVYTDEVADADYLYNEDSKLFMSIDTPRTVKAKGNYVVEHGLGGMFTWTIDQCGAVLVNAAREGLGCTVSQQVIDMEPFYFKGINITPIDPIDPVDPVDPPYPLWSETTTYVGGELVCWKEHIYFAQWWTLGEEPGTPEGTGVSKPWRDDGPYAPVDPVDPPYPLWSETTTYVEGDLVCWNERIYYAQWWTLGEEPGTPEGTGVSKPWRDDGPYLKS